MKPIRTTVAVVALALAALTAGPGELLAQQMYECTTTTHTYTKQVFWSDGRVDTYIWSDTVRVCVPLNEA